VSDRDLVLTRLIGAPRSLVFKAWTDPSHIARWWGPKGFVTIDHEMDVRPGGSYQFRMRGPDGVDLRKRGVYQEIVAPERVVFTFAWADEHGRPGNQTLITVTLEDRGAQTLLTLRQENFDNVENRDSHVVGWTSCLERFAEYMISREALT
jgi:uncharacterized protein YndB with AHSA1/START domain